MYIHIEANVWWGPSLWEAPSIWHARAVRLRTYVWMYYTLHRKRPTLVRRRYQSTRISGCTYSVCIPSARCYVIGSKFLYARTRMMLKCTASGVNIRTAWYSCLMFKRSLWLGPKCYTGTTILLLIASSAGHPHDKPDSMSGVLLSFSLTRCYIFFWISAVVNKCGYVLYYIAHPVWTHAMAGGV